MSAYRPEFEAALRLFARVSEAMKERGLQAPVLVAVDASHRLRPDKLRMSGKCGGRDIFLERFALAFEAGSGERISSSPIVGRIEVGACSVCCTKDSDVE